MEFYLNYSENNARQLKPARRHGSFTSDRASGQLATSKKMLAAAEQQPIVHMGVVPASQGLSRDAALSPPPQHQPTATLPPRLSQGDHSLPFLLGKDLPGILWPYCVSHLSGNAALPHTIRKSGWEDAAITQPPCGPGTLRPTPITRCSGT